jgi:hypothetical protein
MPIIDYNNPHNIEQIKSIEAKYGVPFQQMGELHIIDFYMMASGDIPELRGRLMGIQIELLATFLILCLFGQNFITVSRMLTSRAYALPLWCSFISLLVGTVTLLVALVNLLRDESSCRMTVWLQLIGMSLSMFFNSIILLRKTYLMLFKKKWILYVGSPLIIPQLAYPIVVVFDSTAAIETYRGCVIYYYQFFIWFWVGINIPHNILFSVVFCHAAYKQSLVFGSDTWKRLTFEGLQTMCLSLLCNIISIIIIIFYTGSANKDIFLVIDW